MNEHDVLLSIEEIAYIQDIAYQRNENKKKGNVKDRKFAGNLSSLDVNIYGCAGEYAFAKWEGVEFDDSIHNKRGGHDAIDKRGRKVDVKHSRTNYMGAYGGKKLGQCDIFVFVQGDFPMFRMVGWCYEEELINEDNYGDWYGEGNFTYRLHKDELRSMWSNVI